MITIIVTNTITTLELLFDHIEEDLEVLQMITRFIQLGKTDIVLLPKSDQLETETEDMVQESTKGKERETDMKIIIVEMDMITIMLTEEITKVVVMAEIIEEEREEVGSITMMDMAMIIHLNMIMDMAMIMGTRTIGEEEEVSSGSGSGLAERKHLPRNHSGYRPFA